MSIFNGPQPCCPSPSVSATPAGGSTASDAFGRLRVSNPFTLFDSHQQYEPDIFFVSNVVNGGTITYISVSASCNLTANNQVGSFAGRETKYVFVYQPGKSLLALATFVMAPASNGLVQRVGYFGNSNGTYIELSDKTYIVKRSNTFGSIVTTMVPQDQWNADKMDGFGQSGIVLDITKAQIFWTDIEWLGVGNLRVGFIINGQYHVCHVFQHANIINFPYMSAATLPIRYEITNTNGSAPISTLRQVCSSVISEGGYDQLYTLHSNIAYFNQTMTTGVWYPLMSIQLVPTRLDAVVQVKQFEIIMLTSDTVQCSLWSNVSAASLGNPSFAQHYSSRNVQFNGNAASFNILYANQLASTISSGTNQASSRASIEFNRYFSQIGRNSFTGVSDILTLAVMNIKPGGPAVTLQALMSWNELL